MHQTKSARLTSERLTRVLSLSLSFIWVAFIGLIVTLILRPFPKGNGCHLRHRDPSFQFRGVERERNEGLPVLHQSPIPIPWATDGAGLISKAEVFETSAPSWGASLALSSVKSMAWWLARERET
jgi:hypothetical protein